MGKIDEDYVVERKRIIELEKKLARLRLEVEAKELEKRLKELNKE